MNIILGLGMPGWGEGLLIVFVILLLFGGKKIPELMRGLGKGIREFNAAKATVKSEIESGMKEEEEDSSANRRVKAPEAKTESKEAKD